MKQITETQLDKIIYALRLAAQGKEVREALSIVLDIRGAFQQDKWRTDKPPQSGVYEIHSLRSGTWYSYFNGLYWGWVSDEGVQDAYERRNQFKWEELVWCGKPLPYEEDNDKKF